MVTVHYRRWCPPRSPLQIEFPPELLRDVRREGFQPASRLPLRWIPRMNRAVNQSSGLLFGVRHEDEVRVMAARESDGMSPLGIFVCRERGEVFLTDDDLADFEKQNGVLALVIAGGRAGFFVREAGHVSEGVHLADDPRLELRLQCVFVREADGSVQAIRSHEEFKVSDVSSQPVSDEAGMETLLPVPEPRSWRAWKRIAACSVVLAIPAGAFAYLRPLLPSLPLALAVREEAGQLRIGWNAGALAEGSRLEIQDGSERTILMLYNWCHPAS